MRKATAQERAEDEEFAAFMGRFEKALVAVADAVGNQRGISGEIECPNCHSRLFYGVAASNGHLRVRCSTPDCVSFLQ